MARHATPEDLAAYARATSHGGHPPLVCCHCGDSLDAPERDCPSPDRGRAPYKDSGRGGHRFKAPEQSPPNAMSRERLLQLRALSDANLVQSDDRGLLAGALSELLVEHDRLEIERKRLQRYLLTNARVDGECVFSREQIERLMAD